MEETKINPEATHPQETQQVSPTPTPAPNSPQENKIDWGGELQRFFKTDLKNLFINLFKHPASGAQKFLATSSPSVANPLYMVVLSFVVITFFSFLCMAINGFAEFRPCVILGLAPIFFSVFITLILFVFLAIKQKPDILLAFRHSAIHVMLLSIVMLFGCLLTLFADTSLFNIMSGDNQFIGILFALTAIYAISMGISAVRQTLQTCETSEKEGYVWYVSPLVIILSLWLTGVIIKAIIF
ncbi:MAG: hypothetical protein J5642_06075 [Bacteroidales bacterium]|nr:hypothetical protein [Bacteroidales bacterium]